MRQIGLPGVHGTESLLEAVNLTDVLVIERREHLRLAPEPGEPVQDLWPMRQAAPSGATSRLSFVSFAR